MIKSLALARLKSPQTKAKTQTLARTDVKGAAVAVQKIFDKYKLGLKVKPIPATREDGNDDREASMDVYGKTPYGEVAFLIYLSGNEKGLVFEHDTAIGVDLSEVLTRVSTGDKAYLDTDIPEGLSDLKKFVSRVDKARQKSNSAADFVANWWANYEKAVTEISQVMKANRK